MTNQEYRILRPIPETQENPVAVTNIVSTETGDEKTRILSGSIQSMRKEFDAKCNPFLWESFLEFLKIYIYVLYLHILLYARTRYQIPL